VKLLTPPIFFRTLALAFAFALTLTTRAANPPAPAAASTPDDFASLGMKASVTIIFDTSGSMNERNKLTMAKRAFNWWIETAPQQSIAQWSLWAFSSERRDGVNLVDRKPGAAAEVKEKIGRFTATGDTPLGATVARVTKIIDAENKKAEQGKADILRQIVLIFTDGKDSHLSVGDMQKTITRLRNAGSEVFSIGYQGEGDYLAKVSDKFIMVDDEKQLKSGLSEFTYFIEKAAPKK
jgi:Mg-chelatase subunit ChlD